MTGLIRKASTDILTVSDWIAPSLARNADDRKDEEIDDTQQTSKCANEGLSYLTDDDDDNGSDGNVLSSMMVGRGPVRSAR